MHKFVTIVLIVVIVALGGFAVAKFSSNTSTESKLKEQYKIQREDLIGYINNESNILYKNLKDKVTVIGNTLEKLNIDKKDVITDLIYYIDSNQLNLNNTDVKQNILNTVQKLNNIIY